MAPGWNIQDMSRRRLTDIADPAFKADPGPTLKRLRAEGSVSKVRAGRRRAWLVTGYADAVAALKHPDLVKDKASVTGKAGP
jgi:cytochrome P450